MIAAATRFSLGGITFNGIEDGGVEWWATLGGWGSPASTLNVQQKTAQNGGYAPRSYLKPRTLTITGSIVAPTAAALLDAKDRLIDAVNLDDRQLVVVEGGQSRRCMARRDDDVLFGDEAETFTTFSAQLVALDPLKYGDPITLTASLPSSTGGLTWPVSWPINWGGTVKSGLVHIDNPGKVTSPVLIRIDGPVTGPRVRHLTSGLEVQLSTSYDLGAGSFLLFDMANRVVLENGTAQRSSYVVNRGWFGLDPGANDFLFDAQVRNTSAVMTLTTAPAWP